MSLTKHIKNKTNVYHTLRRMLDMRNCEAILLEQNGLMGYPLFTPEEFDLVNFAYFGSAVIYAVREYLFSASFWEQTIMAKSGYACPTTPAPQRWFDMASIEADYRTGTVIKMTSESLRVMSQDMTNIVRSFPMILGQSSQYFDVRYHMNPTFKYSNLVGGADANMIIGDTLWDVRTTLKRRPFTLDDIIQQIGYVVLNYNMTFDMKQITWYYTRQMKLFTYPVSKLFNKEVYEHDFFSSSSLSLGSGNFILPS